MENEDRLAKMVLTDRCCSFCAHSYRLNSYEEYRCCDSSQALDEGLLTFEEDGFANSTRNYYTCKYFTKAETTGRIYKTVYPVDEDVSKIPGYEYAVDMIKGISDKNLEEANAIYSRNPDDVAKYFANKKSVQTDPDVTNIEELALIAKMANGIEISDLTKKVVKIGKGNPYE